MLSNSKLHQNTKNIILQNDFRFHIASLAEQESCFIRIIDMLTRDKIPSGPTYHKIWENGWKENFEKYQLTNNLKDLIPKFVRNNDYIRLNGNYIKPISGDFETSFVSVLRDYYARKYFSNVDHIYEFGCGTGLNLVQIAEIFPEKTMLGLDWSESAVNILNLIQKNTCLKIKGKKFNMFDPDKSMIEHIARQPSALLTIGAMEQLGTNFQSILDFTLESNFDIIVHFETIYEDYNPNTLFDYLPIKYIEKRNWLRGYYTKLYRLAQESKIIILEHTKTFGSFFHDGYTVTVWKKNV
jgi:hypothetical protein